MLCQKFIKKMETTKTYEQIREFHFVSKQFENNNNNSSNFSLRLKTLVCCDHFCRAFKDIHHSLTHTQTDKQTHTKESFCSEGCNTINNKHEEVIKRHQAKITNNSST